MAQVLLDARRMRICLNCQGDVPDGPSTRLFGQSACRCPVAPLVERFLLSSSIEVVESWGAFSQEVAWIFEEWGPMPEGFSWSGDDAA